MSASPVSLPAFDARLAVFGSKDEYLAFKAAWQALARARIPLPASFYAAHATLMGRDLYKAFSPSKRPHDKDQPFGSLLRALDHLASPHGARRHEVRGAALDVAQLAALRDGIICAADAVQSLDLQSFSARQAIATGRARLSRAAAAAEA